ncbi:flagellin [Mangrovibacillus sp. Mu-81]|uniref:flagellin N-terminal helical domain-containing protein n=1 Tax=Mangrovibacillus sp. Mu-81 TaxID=3121478 RepID=UPI002FE4957A
MRINHNIAALNTYRQLNSAAAGQSKSMEKLSSGLRINRAGDDAAGLAISEKMRGQIRGLDMASKNAQDGISLIQTAEGALNETHSILQRMRELSVQSANDTNTADDRAEIQKEIDQLTNEVDRIGNTTEFNTKKLLNGSANVGTSFSVGTAVDTAKITNITGTGETQVGGQVAITAATAATSDVVATSSTGGFTSATATFSGLSEIVVNGTKFSFNSTDTVQDAIDQINNANVGATVALNTSDELEFTSTNKGSATDMTIAVGGTAGDFTGMGTQTEGVDASLTITGTPVYTAEGNHITIMDGTAEGLSFDLTADLVAAVTIDVDSNGTLNMQIGANEGQEMNIGIADMRAAALGVDQLDLTSQNGAKNAITTIDAAIKSVSSERSKLGAYQNRLDHTINNLGTSSENLTAAESRIRDVDYALAA